MRDYYPRQMTNEWHHLLPGRSVEAIHARARRMGLFARRARGGFPSRLNEAIVRTLRAEYIPHKVTVRALAERYALSPSTVEKAVAGWTWKWVR